MTSFGDKLVHKEIHRSAKVERTNVNKQRCKVLCKRQTNKNKVHSKKKKKAFPGIMENHGNLETRVMESLGQRVVNRSVHSNYWEGLLKQTAGSRLQSF